MLKKINLYLYRTFKAPFYKRTFKEFGFGSYIFKPLKIDGRKNITIGNRVIIEYKTWLAAVPLTDSSECKLEIGDGSVIGHFNHIYATRGVCLGKNVLTADKVYISDNLHKYDNVNVPIMHQPIKQIKEVEIGDGSWIGENVCILGCRIGKHCVIGANAVVTKDIPPYSVAVGNPARIIKRYCFETSQWRKTDAKGNFIEA